MKTKGRAIKVVRRRPKGTGGAVEKGGKWYGRIRRNGAVEYTDPYNDAEAAEKALDRMLGTGVNPRFIPTLSEYWLELLADGGDFEDRYDKGTCDLYDTCRARYFATEDGKTKRIGYGLGAMRLDQIRTAEVQRVVNKLYGCLAPSTVRRYASCLHTVLQHAVRAEILSPRFDGGRFIPANPADGIEYRPIPAAASYIFSNSELVKVPELLYAWKKRLSGMVTVLADTGVRPGELCAMDAADISGEGVWTIRDTRRRDGTLKGTTKTHRIRAIMLSEDARAAVEQLGAKKGPVWLNEDGNPIRPSALGLELRRFRARLQKEWNEDAARESKATGAVVEAATVPPLTPRNLRKTFATRAVESGDIKSAQAALGHATSKTTLDIYAKARQNPQNELIRRLSESAGNRGLFGHRDQDRDQKVVSASHA
ncbi:MAG: tyrosine-type recombinase/integrase [Fimbriimonadales bacterium]